MRWPDLDRLLVKNEDGVRRTDTFEGPVAKPYTVYADQAAEIQANAIRMRGLNPDVKISASMVKREVEISKLSPPPTRPFADPVKLERLGTFNWNEYRPIWVQDEGGQMTIMDGMTRVEAARRAGITKLPAYIFKD